MNRNLKGVNFLITSGPTRAPIDAVRFLSNRSTGRLGARIAEEALRRGAHVTMAAGTGSCKPEDSANNERLRIICIETVEDLLHLLKNELTGTFKKRYNVIVHAMAVLDYEPEQTIGRKVKSDTETWILRMKKTPKVIAWLKKWAPDTLLFGFKLESGGSEAELQEAAVNLQNQSHADFVVANDLQQIEEGRHPALVIGRKGHIIARPDTKERIAHCICDIVADPDIS